MIDGQNFFDQPVKNDLRTYDNIKKTATSQGDDYPTYTLLNYFYFINYFYFKKHYKMIKIDSSKRQAIDPDPKAM